MSSGRKEFDEGLFKKFDEKGKKAIIKYFESKGHLLAFNPNDYLADLILLQKTEDGLYEKIALVEVGVRPSWSSSDWPSSWSLRIEQRKAKYLSQGLPVWFCVLNKDLSSCVMLKRPLTDYPIQNVTNRFFSNGKTEQNYIIPNSDIELVQIKPEQVENDF
ncbi:MAG: hypothetical protein IPK04_14725 [Bdellovibrionales bacterium]|nr:hypothetical protein [Bdellovibrionales bacterium]